MYFDGSRTINYVHIYAHIMNMHVLALTPC
jgi:hypothetical protein